MATDGLPAGADALYAKIDSLNGQISTLEDQSNAAIRNKDQQAFDQYQAQAGDLRQQVKSTQAQLTQLIVNDPGTSGDIATPVNTLTTGQSQSTPAANARDDGPTQAPTSSGTGAGTGQQGGGDNPGASSNTTQQAINTAFSNQLITSQPNVLDQYASYTYAISWWLLTPDQYNTVSSSTAPAPNTGNWSLLVQSGGAPIKGRNQAFPDDYYFDDLEIESTLAGKGANMSNNSIKLGFKIVEPNGLTLLQNLFKAVSSVYKSTTQPINYVSAIYCLTIEFYGYDSQGKLAAPATGSLYGSNAQTVIKKYYPFIIDNIVFRTVAEQIEYYIQASSVPYSTATSQARGTIPFSIALSGQTVGQLLQGSPAGAATAATADKGARLPTAAPTSAPAIPDKYNTPGWDNLASDVQMRAQQSWMDTYGRRYNADGSANWGGG